MNEDFGLPIEDTNAVCAQHLFPFAHRPTDQSMAVLKDLFTHNPNAEVSLPSQVSRFISTLSDIPAIVAACWNPQLVEHAIQSGCTIPMDSHAWHADILDVWTFGTQKRTEQEIKLLAPDFARSLQLLNNAGYDLAEYKDPNSTNDRNRRLSFLHSMLWRLDAQSYPEILFSECLNHNIPVSNDFLGDAKYRQDKLPNLYNHVQHYMLSEATQNSANQDAPSKRVSKI